MILIDAAPLVFDPARGVARALTQLVFGLADHGVEARLLAPQRLGLEIATRMPQEVAEAETPKAWRKQLPGLVERVGGRVLIAPWSATPPVSVPVIQWIHELPFVRLGPIEGRVRTWRHRRWLRQNARDAAWFVVPSTATREDLLALHPELAERSCEIPHGFDPAPWERGARIARAAKRIPFTYLLAVGSGVGAAGERKKGMDVLAAAAKELALDPPLFVWGELEEYGNKHLASVPDVLRMMSIEAAVGGARLVVHPARSEGFGFPPLEAMAAGVPVVCSDGGALPQTVGEAARVVPAGDSRALVEAIRAVLADDDVRADLVRRGHERAKAFDPHAIAGRWLALIDEVAG